MDWFIFVLGVVVSSIVTVAILLVGKMEDRMRITGDNLRRADTEV